MQNDPFSAQRPHFDFQELRREGLKHIGGLSGKIWTDHNAHDPGVTILEELCYALIDLGYRTTLPMEDLLAEPRGNTATGTDAGSPRHENFFTPHEILSCNPTTAFDFRKLLIDVDGVRNAWLEPADTDTPPYLYLPDDFSPPELQCWSGDEHEPPSNPVVLNGLYRILIQKEIDADGEKVVQSVMEKLSAYRNLCEDFSSITMLSPLDVGVCADVEIEEAADAAAVYEAIARSVRSYVAPEIRHYTLKELLDKGRAIEEIFAGRPFMSSRTAGFVDTEELKGLPFRYELHGSDLYAAILSVKGVVRVRDLSFRSSGTVVGNTIQRVPVPPGYIAEFSLDKTCIQLQTSRGILFQDKERIHRRLLEGGKPRRGPEHLDLPIPEGRYRPGLGDYYSIQHDFPLVYGIGEGGLSDEATPLRKTQAMQLKGYLLFYDQLLANYLAQIANFRHLFSIRVESKRPDSERHTYFSQDLENVPDRERLYPRHPGRELTSGNTLAVPVAENATLAKKLEALKADPLKELRITDGCEPAPGEIPHFAEASKPRIEVRIRQSIRDFLQGDYSLELSLDRNGYLFILRFRQACEWLLVSYQRYKNKEYAREAANFAAFLASQPEYYARRLQQVDPDAGHIAYQFDLVYDPAAYTAYLQFLAENEELYLQRREAFLDHLLARFAVQFTDYALLMFGAEAVGIPERRRTIEDKSRFLSQVDHLSRDRGRAFDYLKPSWGTENVSGFEKRVSLLAGMQEFRRRHLCKYEVVERFRIEIEDPDGNPWFSSIETYRSRKELDAARRDFVEQLREPAMYDRFRRRTRGFDPISAGRIFSRVATDENIEVSRYVYALNLKDSRGDVLRVSGKTDYAEESQAWQGLANFIREIESDGAMELVETGPQSRSYIDNRRLHCRIDPIITYKWHRYDSRSELIASASKPHNSPASAVDDFAASGDYGDLIVPKTDVVLWRLRPGERCQSLESIYAYDDELEAQRGWLRCKSDGQVRERYRQDPEPGGLGTIITLTTEAGFELATAVVSDGESVGPDEYIGLCQEEFAKDEAKLEFSPLSTAFGWRLAQQGGEEPGEDGEIIESALLYRDVPGALFGLLDALAAAKSAKNYFEAGTEDNPDYRILLRSSAGPFIATTPSYADATERKENLAIVKNWMKRLTPPLEVREEPRLYRWTLCHATSERVVLEPEQNEVFEDEKAARDNFDQRIRRVREKQPSSPVGEQVFAVELKEIADKFRFIYCLNGPGGEASPLLRSEKEYGADEARERYSEFVAGLPKMEAKIQNDTARVIGTDLPAAVLIDDTQSNRTKVERQLKYLRSQYGDTRKENVRSKWIYRLLDRDNPIARSKNSHRTEQDAKKVMEVVCGYEPCPPVLKKDVVRIVCPESDRGKYHYALFLGSKDEDGVECATLISYTGYATEDAAKGAGEKNWLKLIERAVDPENYGDDRTIAVKETYAESTGSDCDRAGAHLAVKPEAVEITLAVILAKCYPVRITYRKDDNGKPTSEAIGFHFQGYDRGTDACLWRSTVDYSTVDQALEAYRLFLTLLGNSNSCRIVCDEGCYRIHLVEILAESGEFDTEADAWGDMPEVTKDECGRSICPAKGVRLFARTATAEAAFVPVRDGDCYRFDILGKGYVLARHTCDYHSRGERDEAMGTLHDWARSLSHETASIFTGSAVEISPASDDEKETPVDESAFLQFRVGPSYFLQSFLLPARPHDAGAQGIVDKWLWFALSSRNYRWNGYDLRLTVAKATGELEDEAKSLVIVALVDGGLHIRIFDSKGTIVVDRPENELDGGEPLQYLKDRLMSSPDEPRLSLRDKGTIIERATSIAGHTRQDRDYANKWILVNPLEGDLEIASVEHVDGSDVVDIEAFRELAREYPIFRRDDGYRFRLYSPEYGVRLDEELRICGCNENDRRQRAGLAFCDPVYVYESTESYACRDAALQAFMRFLDLLADFKNYLADEETGLGAFSFSIIDREQVLASYPYNHPDRTGALRAQERALACVRDEGLHLVEHILLRPTEDCECLLPVCPDPACNLVWQEDLDPDDPCSEEENPPLSYVPGTDPYSFWATVVLPGWTERFRSGERRQFFRQMLYREVPAMVGLNIVWLGPRQMCEFEMALKPWLSSRRYPPTLCEGENDPFCDMAKSIGRLRNEPPCPDPDSAAAECDCDSSEYMGRDDPCIEDSESLFWLECQPKTKTDNRRQVVAEDTAKEVDAADIRKCAHKRRELYYRNVDDIDYAPATDTESYKRARHFLKNAPNLNAFNQFAGQVIPDMPRKRTKKGDALVVVFSNTFWYLLDHLLQEHPTEVPPDARKMLPPLLRAVEKKGVVLEKLAEGWKGEVFGDLFGPATARVVNEYLTLTRNG